MRYFIIILSMLFAASPTSAATISEIKGGALTQASSFATERDTLQPWLQHDESGASLQGEVLFDGPECFRHIFTPRVNVGAAYSTAGDTNYIYSGLYWDGDLGSNFFLGGFFGLALHDGDINAAPARYASTRNLGNAVLFRLGPEIGYNLTENWNIAFTWAHLSHGWILNGFDGDGVNEGLDQMGLRVGYKF